VNASGQLSFKAATSLTAVPTSKPHGGAHQILEGDADGRAIAGRGSTEGRVLEQRDSSRS
jgi:hypothetical protein